ncbi:helix-turn-helix domain-containing protein [Cohnella herbarum]|uniref:Helix-turn-helix domain-containing protein n=1 Tax=Cohnella herbarum TaxID=2728023 RepID=A0A7Z2VJA4_9BACL|nr:helix-turn-helix domain-containing protein [Cohnella herbarum]QJD84288.1 helix-turn-helix domain-containing protein [Cohnella herbarum]
MTNPNTKFARTKLLEPLAVNRLVSFHYFEFSKDFAFEGEKHDFWEFVYVDKGEMEVFADTEGYRLKQGDMIFHKPNEFHGVWANKKIAPNVIILSFVCRSREMAYFENKIFTLDAEQREILAQIMKSGFAAFLPPFDDPRNHTLRRKPDAPIGTEQLIKIHLEMLLIRLRDAGDRLARRDQRLSISTKRRSEDDLVNRMREYMEENVFADLRLEDIYKSFNLSKSHALTLFKDCTGVSIMKHYRQLKIDQAKSLIRAQRHTFTEIAELLRYGSVHSFSRHFKSFTDMSPSEYLRTVIAKV